MDYGLYINKIFKIDNRVVKYFKIGKWIEYKCFVNNCIGEEI